MTVEEYERHLFGRLCWHCSVATSTHANGQGFCAGCGRRWSYSRATREWQLVRAFAVGATANTAAQVLGVSYPTAHRVFTACRKVMVAEVGSDRRTLYRVLKLPPARTRPGRGERSGTKSPLLLAFTSYAGRVHALQPDCTADVLLARLERARVAAVVYSTATFCRFADLVLVGRTPRASAPEPPFKGAAAYTEPDRFWVQVGLLVGRHRGITAAHFGEYLAEAEWRWNHPAGELVGALFAGLKGLKGQELILDSC